MKLVITEKPSVAQILAKSLDAHQKHKGYLEGEEYLVSWCLGHMVESAKPEAYNARYQQWNLKDLPIVPNPWKYEISKKTQSQFWILKKLMDREDVTGLICATDAGREGELIFRLLYQKSQSKKSFQRLWISSLEEVAIRKAMDELEPGQKYDCLYQAALCREQADWLLGMNATRFFSCSYEERLNVGRVMTPTLAVVVNRDQERKQFQTEHFYYLVLEIQGHLAKTDRLYDEKTAKELVQQCREKEVRVIKAEYQMHTGYPPKLYNLTALQREANRLLGYTAQQTLEYLQELYEKKLITYPRTDSHYVPTDMEETLQNIVKQFVADTSLKEENLNRKQVLDDTQISDHYAIIPTVCFQKATMKELPKGERLLMELIVRRLFCALGEPYRYEENQVEFICGEVRFSLTEQKTLQKGWYSYATEEPVSIDTLLRVSQGRRYPSAKILLKDGWTTPQDFFTDDTLLQYMEQAKERKEDKEGWGTLGTAATRAGIIEKLIRVGYLERKGKTLQPTAKGKALISIMPVELRSVMRTAQWEEKLRWIEEGRFSREIFMKELQQELCNMMKTYQKSCDPFRKS